MSTDVVASGSAAPITERARGKFDEAQWALLRTFLPVEATDAEVAAFLELSARYELDPFAKQIWAVKIQNKVQVIISRDGLLAIANRHADFRGVESDVVRKHDHFDKWRDETGTQVVHRYRGEDEKPTADIAKRGPIIGAWALCHREGHAPTYFFATWEEYNGNNVWKSHPSAMMQKCPETYVIRKAYSISGVLGEEEAARQTVLTASGGDNSAGEINWPVDPALKDAIEKRAEVLGWRRAKVRMRVNGCNSEEEFRKLIGEMDVELDQQGLEAEALEAPEVADAVVVEDGAPLPDEGSAPADPEA